MRQVDAQGTAVRPRWPSRLQLDQAHVVDLAGHGLLMDVRDPNGLLPRLRELAAHPHPR